MGLAFYAAVFDGSVHRLVHNPQFALWATIMTSASPTCYASGKLIEEYSTKVETLGGLVNEAAIAESGPEGNGARCCAGSIVNESGNLTTLHRTNVEPASDSPRSKRDARAPVRWPAPTLPACRPTSTTASTVNQTRQRGSTTPTLTSPPSLFKLRV